MSTLMRILIGIRQLASCLYFVWLSLSSFKFMRRSDLLLRAIHSLSFVLRGKWMLLCNAYMLLFTVQRLLFKFCCSRLRAALRVLTLMHNPQAEVYLETQICYTNFDVRMIEFLLGILNFELL